MSHDDPLDRLTHQVRRTNMRQVMWYFIDEREGHEMYCMAVSPDERDAMRANPHLKEVDHRDYWRFARRIGGLNP